MFKHVSSHGKFKPIQKKKKKENHKKADSTFQVLSFLHRMHRFEFHKFLTMLRVPIQRSENRNCRSSGGVPVQVSHATLLGMSLGTHR